MAPLISILICSNRAPGTLDVLLSSIGRQRFIEDCEIVFVDNGIEKRRADEIKERLAGFPCESRYVVESRPGIWAARKTSYENARGRWLFTLDDDNTLEDGALASLVRFIEDHPEVGGICPRLMADWEVTPPPWLQVFGRLCLSYTESGEYGPGIGETVWKPGDPGIIGPPGGGSVVRREAAEAFLEHNGRIPESLRKSRLGSEDYAMYSYAYRLGYDTAYVPSVVVYHRIPKERLGLRYLTRMNLKTAYAYGQLEHTWRDLSLKNIAGLSYRFLKSGILSPPHHPAAIWLNIVRGAGFAAGLFKTRYVR